MLKDLSDHIEEGKFLIYFESDVNHAVFFCYDKIHTAIRSEAQQLKFGKKGFTWIKEDKILGEYRLDEIDPKNLSSLIAFHRKALDKIFNRDVVVQGCTKIIKNTPDEMVVEFLYPPTSNEVTQEN